MHHVSSSTLVTGSVVLAMPAKSQEYECWAPLVPVSVISPVITSPTFTRSSEL